MSLLLLSQVSYHYSYGDPVFSGASFSVDPGDRIALVGANGAGKSTLLRVVAGQAPGGGSASGGIVRRQGLAVAMLEQSVTPSPAATLLEFVLSARPELLALRGDAERAGEYYDAGGYDAESEAMRSLFGLGFCEADLDRPAALLSGGQRTRAALARTLLLPCELLLLDEPTNHLDTGACEWLEDELLRRPGACVIASHDRTLLRRVATRVVEIERGKVRVFEIGYDDYRERRALLDRQAWAEFDASERRRAANEQAAERRMRLAAKMTIAPEGARHSKDFYARKAAQVQRTARILREREQIEPVAEKPWEEREISSLRFEASGAGPAFPLVARELARRFGDRTVFSGLSLEVRRGERVLIAGPNGCGKTTLLRLLAGLDAPENGEVRLAAGARIGYLEQETVAACRQRASALELCGSTAQARTMLGCLKLPAARLNSPLASLSGGERTKVMLARLLLSDANLLLLDEPTNHLEIEAREALEQALAEYPGAVVAVSHDRAFAENLDARLVRMG